MKFSIILIIFLFTSCANKSYNILVNEINVLDLINQLKENQGNLKSIKALAKVSIESKDERIFFDQVTIAQKSNYLRLEAIAAFGATVAQVLSDSDKVYFITRTEKLVFDDSDNFNFSYLYPDLPPELKVSNLINVLLAGIPFDVWDDEYEIEFSGITDNFKIKFQRNDKMTLTINTKLKTIEQITYKLDTGILMNIIFSNFISVKNNQYFPKNIVIKSGDYILGIKYNENLLLNESLSISLFEPTM